MSKTTCTPDGFPVEPVIEPLRRLAGDVINELARAQQLIRTRTEEFFSRHAELVARSRAAAEQAADIKRHAAELTKQERKLDARKHELEANCEQMAKRECRLADDDREIKKAADVLSAERANLDKERAALGDQSSSLDQDRTKLADLGAQLQSQQESFDRRESEIRAAEQKLRTQVAEFETRRDAMAVIADQIDHDREQIASQRTELMQRLEAMPSPPKELDTLAVEMSEMPVIATPTPKAQPIVDHAGPAEFTVVDPKTESSSAFRFRKLRRDAKRRIKGFS